MLIYLHLAVANVSFIRNRNLASFQSLEPEDLSAITTSKEFAFAAFATSRATFVLIASQTSLECIVAIVLESLLRKLRATLEEVNQKTLVIGIQKESKATK